MTPRISHMRPMTLCIFYVCPLFCSRPRAACPPPFLVHVRQRDSERKKGKHLASPIDSARFGLSCVQTSRTHTPPLHFFSLIDQRCIFPCLSPFFCALFGKKGIQQNARDAQEKKELHFFPSLAHACVRPSLATKLPKRARTRMTTSCALCFLDNVPLTHVVSWTMFECGCAIHQDKTVCIACFVALSQTQSPCPWCRARLHHYRRCGPRKTRALTLPTPSSASLAMDVAHRSSPSSATCSHLT